MASSDRRPGQRAGLDRAAIVAAARMLLAEQGLDGVSMRSVSGRLGVSPNALYSHVEGKTDLIDELLDDVLAEVVEPEADDVASMDGLTTLMTSTFGVLLTHADLVPAYIDRRGASGPNARRLGDVALALLADGGVEGPEAEAALHVLIVYVVGFAAFATEPPRGTGAATRPGSADRLGAEFAEGLRWLLIGILGLPSPTRSKGVVPLDDSQ